MDMHQGPSAKVAIHAVCYPRETSFLSKALLVIDLQFWKVIISIYRMQDSATWDTSFDRKIHISRWLLHNFQHLKKNLELKIFQQEMALKQNCTKFRSV